jgi:NAD(P)-dependent dehydrogenase (short-subunit alcohol dehydrogenase family)
MTDEEKATAAALIPLGRIGIPDDLGKAAVFLASADSAYATRVSAP